MLGTQNQLRSEFEAQLLSAMNFAPFVGRTLYRRDELGRYEQKWVEDRWHGYMLGHAHAAKE